MGCAPAEPTSASPVLHSFPLKSSCCTVPSSQPQLSQFFPVSTEGSTPFCHRLFVMGKINTNDGTRDRYHVPLSSPFIVHTHHSRTEAPTNRDALLHRDSPASSALAINPLLRLDHKFNMRNSIRRVVTFCQRCIYIACKSWIFPQPIALRIPIRFDPDSEISRAYTHRSNPLNLDSY
jgi:hypothetical protein